MAGYKTLLIAIPILFKIANKRDDKMRKQETETIELIVKNTSLSQSCECLKNFKFLNFYYFCNQK